MSIKELQTGMFSLSAAGIDPGIPIARRPVSDLPAVGPEAATEQAECLRSELAGLLGPTKVRLSHNVARRCEAIAAQLPLDAASVARLTLAAHVHRAGELCLPASLTRKCFLDMSTRELAVYSQYPLFSTLFLTEGRPGNPFFDLMLSHREYVLGAGFPLGKDARWAPLEARVLCIATEYEELMMHRGGTPEEEDTILRFMMSNLACRYQPELVERLLATVADDNGRH